MDGEVEWRVSVVGSSVDARTGTPQTCIKRLLIGESMRRSGVPCCSASQDRLYAKRAAEVTTTAAIRTASASIALQE